MTAQAQQKPTARSRRRGKEQPDEPLSKSLYPILVVAGLLVASVVSALEMVDSAHRKRSLYQELALVQQQQMATQRKNRKMESDMAIHFMDDDFIQTHDSDSDDSSDSESDDE